MGVHTAEGEFLGTVTLVQVQGGRVRLGFTAPGNIIFTRPETREREPVAALE